METLVMLNHCRVSAHSACEQQQRQHRPQCTVCCRTCACAYLHLRLNAAIQNMGHSIHRYNFIHIKHLLCETQTFCEPSFKDEMFRNAIDDGWIRLKWRTEKFDPKLDRHRLRCRRRRNPYQKFHGFFSGRTTSKSHRNRNALKMIFLRFSICVSPNIVHK